MTHLNTGSLNNLDVVCVGAGFAGLTAAVALEGGGLKVLVVEASERIGGRTWTDTDTDGRAFERGGQLINGDMNRILGHVASAKLSLSAVSMGGAHAIFIDDRLERSDVDDPFRFVIQPSERELGGLSVGDLFRGAELPANRLRMLRSAAMELIGDDPDRLSAVALKRHAMHYHSNRDEAEFQIREGMGALSSYFAEQLRHRVIVEAPVRRLAHNDGQIFVETDHMRWTARACILAMTPVAARAVETVPAWPVTVREALDSFVPGAVIKTVLTYATPFWRLAGLSGMLRFADPTGLCVIDGSRDDGADRLIVFLGGPEARRSARLSDRERRDMVLTWLSRALGPEAGHPLSFVETLWVDDPWCGGGYAAKIRCGGSVDAAETLRSRLGPIGFACSEISDHFPGFVEGAIASGEMAAERVSRFLNLK